MQAQLMRSPLILLQSQHKQRALAPFLEKVMIEHGVGTGAVVPISSEGAVSLGILATHQHIRGHIDFTCFSAGASGVFGFDGYAQGRNGAIYPYSQINATYNTTADITVNMSARFTSAPSGANTARVVFGRLYKISN